MKTDDENSTHPVQAERTRLDTTWPDPPLRIVLIEPEIGPNTGSVARLCAATGTELHLVEPLGFQITDATVRRAGLDYWDAVKMTRHRSLSDFLAAAGPAACFHLLSTRGGRSYTKPGYTPGDWLVFGSESSGLDQGLLDRYPEQTLVVPMQLEHVRSLNLANCASIVLYEALRQIRGDG